MFIFFYTFNTLITWGIFHFAIWKAKAFTYYSIAMFIFATIGFFIMLWTGSVSNRKRRLAEYLNTKISEKKARKEEEILR